VATQQSSEFILVIFRRRIAWLGGDSVVHLSGLVLLARALATGEATVILQAFQHNSFASEPARE